jgi:hypothetical protein
MNTNLYYICEDYSTLAGPYNVANALERNWLNRVLWDMSSGKIDCRVITDEKGSWVQRRGMILTKNNE